MTRKKLTIPDPDDEGQEADADESEPIDWEYPFDVKEMARELEARDRIVGVECEVGSAVANFTVETMEHGLGTTIPRFVKRFYRVADGIRLEWQIRDGDEVRPGGAVHLHDFATVFDSWLDELWTDTEDLDDEEEDFLWSLRGFDAAPEPGDDRMTAVCVEDTDYPTFDLFLHDLRTHDSHLLGVDFHTYLKRLLETRGTYGWVHALADFDGEPPDYVERWREHFAETMEALFPDVDLGPYHLG